ncbi:chemotaxis protein CheB [Ramlibacter sp.]|uniref:chemotaxis protein CheB n=1 Tax=Ramlibacter sp. TaxID=1917967 RepID=UPI00182E50C0|nr:chemotaxis protein CheB [Ramlibacter sp.]MBA2676091.1 PAS domain S-box protein [Ramlibacter sp.]
MKNPLRPDHNEEENPQDIDDMVPTRGYAEVPVVGLGGSAGGIEALQDFFTAMPPNSTLAFIVVMHLSADHESMLPEILQRCTRMPVCRVEDGMKVEPAHVYVIPGGKLIRCVDGHLTLEDLPDGRSRHVTVDVFFRSLADTHGPHAAAVILSGMDGDGAIGIKRIKERGGLAIAHDPEEAKHDSMPRAAIATGMVDWVLPVRDIPSRLMSYFRLEDNLLLPREVRGPLKEELGEEEHLTEVLRFLHSRTGRNFELYKRGTVVRRLARRMQLNGVDNLKGYLTCLQTRPGETTALVQDLLISVTNFFRDATCFEALEQHIPSLFAGKGVDDVVRVWVVACATGEEAYSTAVLLAEYAETLESPPSIQVFATDLDEEAIQAARYGVYPAAITADVSEQRLRRFFQKDVRGWRVRRELRENILFAVHDVLRDPPFSHLDLVTCRNLLIYLTREAQQRVLQTLHFALKPRTLLMLGSSETVDEGSAQFEPLDKKNRLYRQVSAARISAPLPSTLLSVDRQSDLTLAPSRRGGTDMAVTLPAVQSRATIPGISWREIHLQLIEHLAPPSVLVDSEYDILHVSQGAARLLQFPAGESTRSLLRALPPPAYLQLREALGQAAQTTSAVMLPAVELEPPGGKLLTRVRVVPLPQPAGPLFLVTFDPVESEQAPAGQSGEDDPLSRHLDFEMDRLKQQLRDTAEQYEASSEELKASNEELQAMYEEMRAQTEELETGKEELQSVNEELSTVNYELKDKIEQLSLSNSDMQNLMDATAIATVFLDRELCITRYTPAAIKLFNLIPTDVGRPLTDMATHLDYPQLGGDARGVLERLVPVEREVGQSDGSCYLARLMPYRTVDDRIAGVVFTFIDISERRRAEGTRLWLSAVVTSTPDAIVSFALDQTILSWNSGAERMFGFSAQEAVGKSMLMLAPAHEEEQERLASDVNRGRTIENLETVRRCKDGRDIHVGITAAPIRDGSGAVVAVSMILRDISVARANAEALRQSEERLRMLLENVVEYAVFSMDLQRRITLWNSGAERFLGWSEREALGQAADMIFTPEDRAAGAPAEEARTALREGRSSDERPHLRKDGSRIRGVGILMLMRNAAGEPVGFVKILRDADAPLPQPDR